jgi:dTDP-4-amino-4,6-dideoxygalactose transaminase
LFRENGCPSRDDCVVWSGNSRMDTVQAAMLLVKLKHMEEWTQKRIKNAAFYQTHLSNVSGLKLPRPQQGIRAVYHTFVVQAEDRDVLRKFLLDNGIKTKIHYPTPVHQQTAGREFYKAGMDLARTEDQAKKILSLPVHQDLTEDQLSYVVGKIKEFYQQKG